MANEPAKLRAPVLDPVERVSEVIFGVLMALTFTGSLSVATAGHQEIRTLMLSALGCNIAWGLTDAVMYLLSALTERQRKAALLRRIQTTADPREAHRLIADALPGQLLEHAGEGALETLRQRLLSVAASPTELDTRDCSGALAVFVLVVIATLPVVLPFFFISDAATALRVSNLLALATLFAGGFALGRFAGGRPWRYGLGMAVIGAALVAIIIGLGG